jgi:hypothetical protein
MRPRFIFSVLILVIVVLAVVFWLRPTKHATTPPNRTVHLLNGAPAKPTAPSAHPHAANSNVTANNPTSPKPFSVAGFAKRRQNAVRQINEQENEPIEFYGQVIDQNSNGIPGVDIVASVQQPHASLSPAYNVSISNTVVRLDEKTGEDGRFQIEGEIGKDVSLESVKKTGYQLSPKAPRFFGQSSGSFENPVIIRMWKLGEGAKLTSGSKFWGIIPDGRVYTIDFLRQEKIESSDAPGDIRISVDRPIHIAPRTKFDWSFSIEAINGGLLEAKDPFMYLAPESGYQPSYQFTMSSTNADWKRELDGLQFYLESRGGRVHGRFTFDLIPDYNNLSVFNVSWAINPTGSRNLQP